MSNFHFIESIVKYDYNLYKNILDAAVFPVKHELPEYARNMFFISELNIDLGDVVTNYIPNKGGLCTEENIIYIKLMTASKFIIYDLSKIDYHYAPPIM